MVISFKRSSSFDLNGVSSNGGISATGKVRRQNPFGQEFFPMATKIME